MTYIFSYDHFSSILSKYPYSVFDQRILQKIKLPLEEMKQKESFIQFDDVFIFKAILLILLKRYFLVRNFQLRSTPFCNAKSCFL